MELTIYTAEGKLFFSPPIDLDDWNDRARSFRSGRVLALSDAEAVNELDSGTVVTFLDSERSYVLDGSGGKRVNEVENGTAVFFPEFDRRRGLRAVTVRDHGNSNEIVARLAAFIADWTDTRDGKARNFSGSITGTGPAGEPNTWAVYESRIVDLRLSDPRWLLHLIEGNGKDLIEWLVRFEEADPYGVFDLGESVASLTYELSVLCPGLGGALTCDATLDATHDGITDEEYEAMSDEIAGDVAAQGAWAIAIVAKTLGLTEAWNAHLANRATERRVKGDLNTFAVQAKVITAPDRDEWDDDDEE